MTRFCRACCPSTADPLRIPANLDWLRGLDDGRAWLESLPGLADECVARWMLDLGDPYPESFVSLVVPATTAGGGDAVLKIQWPHRESEQEAAALRLWDGDGAVRLLEHDADRHALLLERCSPGHHLATAGCDAALDVFVDLLPRLWKPAGPSFTSLAEEAARWADELPGTWERAGRPFERRLVDRAVRSLQALPGGDDPVLLHQDLHADNVLAAMREPWLAIDPKPLAGDRAFSAAPIVRSYELGHSPELVEHRLRRLCGELGLDEERAREWAFGQTLAWAFQDDEVLPNHVETARWLVEGR